MQYYNIHSKKKEFHGEGDVFKHAQMAIAALHNLESWQNLTASAKETVHLATLLHDIGKGVTTKKDANGEWMSPNHSRIGSMIARGLIWQKKFGNIPFAQREKIAALIELHPLPVWAYTKHEINHKLRCASQLLPLYNLAILSRADVTGRKSQDQKQLLERINIFERLAQNADCFKKPYPFADNYTRWNYATKRHTNPQEIAHNKSWGEVIVLCGVPGSGKDTWIKKTASQYPMISLDDIREELGVKPSDKDQSVVVEQAFQRAKQLLVKHQPFIWNATNVTEKRRRELIDFFANYGASVRLVYIETQYDKLWKRNQTRERPVPNFVLKRMIETLQVPKPYEAPEVEYVIDE